MKPSWWRTAVPLGVWLAIFLSPVPGGLTQNAWRYFALFAAVIVGLVLEPIPTAAIGFIGVAVATVAGYIHAVPSESVKWGLSGFSDSAVWLVFGAFVLSMGYAKSGLGRRIALVLVKLLGGRTLGLGYAIALADLLIAPGMPSNTARSAGTIYPVIRNIPALFGSEPGPTARKIGAYLMWTAFASTAVTSSMFLTSLAPNLLAVSFVKEATGLEITWGQWCLGFLPTGAVLFVCLPILVYVIYPPEMKSSKHVPAWASQELTKIGRLSAKEVVMAGLVLAALALWVFGRAYISATTVVLIIISLMIITNVVNWNDILTHKEAWNVLVWFATLVTLAGGLNEVGFVKWLAESFANLLTPFSPVVVAALLVTFFFLIHYIFASITAHTAAILPALLAIGAGIPGLPTLPFALLLCYSLGLMGVLTPYATGPAPVYYASGYVSRADFWRLGLIFGLIFLAVLLAVGIPHLAAVT